MHKKNLQAKSVGSYHLYKKWLVYITLVIKWKCVLLKKYGLVGLYTMPGSKEGRFHL